MPRPPALVLDFDGTIVDRDIGDEIADRFGPPGWRALDRLWLAGELTIVEMQRRVWADVRAARVELLRFVDETARFRPGFEALVERALAAGARVVVASGGFDFYVERVLARLGARREAIEVVTNRGTLDGGGGIAVDFPHAAAGCGRCGVCKGAVVARLRAEGRRTIFCGDGGSDRCAIGAADALYAVEGSRLARFCAEAGAPFVAFRSFEDVAL